MLSRQEEDVEQEEAMPGECYGDWPYSVINMLAVYLTYRARG